MLLSIVVAMLNGQLNGHRDDDSKKRSRTSESGSRDRRESDGDKDTAIKKIKTKKKKRRNLKSSEIAFAKILDTGNDGVLELLRGLHITLRGRGKADKVLINIFVCTID